MWELTACLIAYAEKETEASKERTGRAWQTANFANAALTGRLKDLAVYIGEKTEGTAAEPIGRAEFEDKLSRAKPSNRLPK